MEHAVQEIDRAAFLAERQTGIGGSDVHHLFSLEPYGCARRLWYEKSGIKADYPFDGNKATERGARLEDFIADMYSHETGRALVKWPMDRHPQHHWAIVHIDRRFADDDKEIAEIKCPARESFMRMKREGPPLAYVLQAQWGMWIAGAARCTFIVFWPDGFEMEVFTTHRDLDLTEKCMSAGEQFWRLVESGTPPERLAPKDKRCAKCPWRTTCQGERLLAEIPKMEAPDVDEALMPVLREYVDAKAIVDDAEALVGEVRERLEAAIGTREAVEVPGLRAYFRPQISRRLDTKAAEKGYDELRIRYLDAIAGLQELLKAAGELPAVGELLGEKVMAQLKLLAWLPDPKPVDEFKRDQVTRPLRVYPI